MLPNFTYKQVMDHTDSSSSQNVIGTVDFPVYMKSLLLHLQSEFSNKPMIPRSFIQENQIS